MTETITVKVCRECGAEYRSAASRLHVHQGNWKTRREVRETESRLSYQPGYEPTTTEVQP